MTFLGCEPFENGVAMCLGKLRKAAVNNVKIHPGDVRDVFDVLPPASVARAFLPVGAVGYIVTLGVSMADGDGIP